MGRMSVCVHLLLLSVLSAVFPVQGLQVSHQMVQRGHAPAIESTVYHTKYGHHAPAPHHGYGGYPHPAPLPAKYASEPVHYSIHHPKPSPYVAKPKPAPVYQYISEEPHAVVTPSLYEPAHAVPIVDATLYRAPVDYEPVPAPSVHAVHAVPAPVHHAAHAAPVHHAVHAPVHHAVHAVPAPVHHAVHAVHAPVHHAVHAPVHHAVPAPVLHSAHAVHAPVNHAVHAVHAPVHHAVPAPVHHAVHAVHAPVHHAVHAAPVHHVAHPNYIQPSYDVKPHHVVHHKSYAPPPPVYPDEPRLYKYAYSVDDDYEGAVLNVKEASDEYATHGSYEVSLDDGRHQSVSYVSDKHGGYKAKVAYKDQHSSYTRT